MYFNQIQAPQPHPIYTNQIQMPQPHALYATQLQAPQAMRTQNFAETIHFMGYPPSAPLQLMSLPFGYNLATVTQSVNQGPFDQYQLYQSATTSYRDAATQTSDNEAGLPGDRFQVVDSETEMGDEDEGKDVEDEDETVRDEDEDADGDQDEYTDDSEYADEDEDIDEDEDEYEDGDEAEDGNEDEFNDDEPIVCREGVRVVKACVRCRQSHVFIPSPSLFSRRSSP
jgi:hypothetical protein